MTGIDSATRASRGGRIPLPADRPGRQRPPRRRSAPLDVLGGVRAARRPGDRVPARRAGRRLPAASPPLLRPHALAHRPRTTSAAPGARVPMRASSTTRRGRWSRTSRSCAGTSAPSAWSSSAVRGARPSRSPTRRPIRIAAPALVLRGIFLATQREIDWFMHGMGRIFPEAREAFEGFLPAGGAQRPARRTTTAASSTPIQPCTFPPPTPGTATRPRARRCCPAPRARCCPPTTPRRWRSRASRRITSCTRPSSTTTSWSATSGASGICPAPSCTAATTSSARWRAHTRSPVPGRRPSSSIVPDAGHSVREPGIARELVAAVERMKSRIASPA